jgi:hypothetical protein
MTCDCPRSLLAAVTALVAVLVPAVAPSVAKGQDPETVEISGKAYRFNHMSTYLEGVTIRVRELPGVSARTDANGDYALRVPDDTNVTPYIDAGPDYNEIDLQTFHTRGEDIENANFQTPHDSEYDLLAGFLGVPRGADGRPLACVIVTTVSARNVRGVPYETFHERTPHGVEGATARTLPPVPGPIYFNEQVIPDRTKTHSSDDGGIIWSVVPAGTYRIVAEHPTTRFASFLATCENGRVVNANPPWGAYELAPGEEPLGASIVAASVRDATTARIGKGPRKRVARATVPAGERIEATVELRKGGRVLREREAKLPAGETRLQLRIPAATKRGRANLRITLADAAGESLRSRHPIKVGPAQRKRGGR